MRILVTGGAGFIGRHISEYRNRLVSDCSLNKGWNDRRVVISRILVGTKDVKITKANSRESPFIRETAAVPFPFVLTCGIGTFRLGRHAFNLRGGWMIAVNCSRAAKDQLFRSRPRKTTAVPRALISAHSFGFWMEPGTLTMAAKWKTKSTPVIPPLTRSRSRIEPTMSWQSKPDKLPLKPQRRLSRTRTSARFRKCSAICRPMKPTPPVIKIRILG